MAGAAWAAYLAYPFMNVRFASYDDEGYMLSILGGTSSGGDLYDQVFSQYGPFFNEFYNSLFWLLRLPYTHDAGRAVTITGWVLVSVVTGLAAARATKSRAAGFAVQALVFCSMTWAANEPLHPVLLTSLLLAGVFLASSVLDDGARRPALILGVLLACLTLIKINVGLLAVVAVLVAVLFGRGRAARPTLLSRTIAVVLVIVPVLLMARDLSTSASFAILASCAAASVLLAAVQGRTRDPVAFPADLVLPLAAGFAAAASIICALALVRGTSLKGLFDGVLLDPLHQRDVFSIPLTIPGPAIVAGIGGAALVAYLGHWQRTATSEVPVTGLVRLAAAALITMAVARWWGTNPIAYALPLMGLAALPPPGARQTTGRVALPALAVMSSLHAYPVAGSQMGAATFLFLAVAGVCAVDGLRDLSRWSVREPGRLALRGAATAGAALLTIFYAGPPLTRPFERAWITYRAQPSLSLPGAKRIHLDPAAVKRYQDLVAGLRATCSTFYGLPGQNSLYRFSGLPQVNGHNATAWMFLLDDGQQSDVAGALAADRRSCVVRDDALTQGWLRGRALPRGPIVQLIDAQYVPLNSYGSSQILVRRGR
ncbi:MAG: hypothetical protein ACR2KK_07460 [Acidimicrobiales bacterium]